MTGNDVLAALYEITDPLARTELLVEAVQLGLHDPLYYVPIESAHGPHRATFLVSAQPLKFAGVRVTVSARAQQRIADAIGAHLPTPKLLQLMHEQAQIRVAPFTRANLAGMSSTEAMVEASAVIDDRIRRAVASGAPPDGLLSMCGKSWVMTQLARLYRNLCANMGLASNPPPGAPVDWIQLPQKGPDKAHNLDHVDYSQLCWLVFGSCVVDGETVRVETVATDSTLCQLLSNEGTISMRLDLPDASSDAPTLTELPPVDWQAIEAKRILPMHYRPDLIRRPDLVVIHATQGAEVSYGAENTMSWFRTGPFPHGPASVHWTVDNDSIVAGAPENTVAYGARGANHDGIHIEICGKSEQGFGGWNDAYSQAALQRAAQVTARALQTWDLPLRWVPASDLRANYRGVQGITSHVSVSKGRRESTHTDPGPAFPVVRFLRLVEKAMCV